jgi:hypothetical protein
MKLAGRIKDSFLVGMLSGLLSIFCFYFLISLIRNVLVNYYGNEAIMRPPVVQLLTMLLNIIIFRLLMINLEREKTGKGFLFITVLATLVYFFIYFRIKRG